MTRRVVQLKPAERAALREATRTYLKMQEDQTAFGDRDPDRGALVRLRKALRELEAALGPFEKSGINPELTRLLARLQEVQLWQQPQAHGHDVLASLAEPLMWLRLACDAEVGGKRPGREKDADGYRFIAIFADAWTRHGCGNVSAAPGAAFWRALDPDLGHLDERVPQLKPDKVKAAIKLWRKWRAA